MADILQQAREAYERGRFEGNWNELDGDVRYIAEAVEMLPKLADALTRAVIIMEAIRDMPKDMREFDGARAAAIVYADTADKFLKKIGVSE